MQLVLSNPLSPLTDAGFIATTLEQHFQPLLDPSFEPLLQETYPGGVIFLVNGRTLELRMHTDQRAELQVRIGRKRKPAALGYLVRTTDPLPEAERVSRSAHSAR